MKLRMNQNLQQKMMILKKTLACIMVIPNNGCGQELPKITEYNLLVYVDGWTVQNACYMTMSRTATATISTKAYALIYY